MKTRQASLWLKERFPSLHGSLVRARAAAKIARWWPEVSLRHRLRIPLRDRAQLAVLLRVLGLTGEGVEVGVLTGYFSELLIRYGPLRVLHSVDPWKSFSTEAYLDIANTEQADQDKKYEDTCARLSRYASRSHVIRAVSSEAAPYFPDGCLDFVYIDANHTYEGCAEDISLWWPKLKRGGVLAGHDYVDGEFPEGKFGVKSAVDAFAAREQQHVQVVPVLWPTWYVIKK